ncbi:hypothetical protein LP420_35450 [Massilia sp. B-10]|nr:hypothetical protein LP420_35450 [Massilia sp. B-10]
MLCAGLPSERDELLNELFVLALREAGVDARSASPENREERPEGVDKLVAMVFLSYPLAQSLPEWQIMARQLRSNLPHAILVTLRLLSEGEDDKEAIVARCRHGAAQLRRRRRICLPRPQRLTIRGQTSIKKQFFY